MGVKQIMVAQCDICGAMEPAKAERAEYNGTRYTIPDDWQFGTNEGVTICPKCAELLSMRIKKK